MPQRATSDIEVVQRAMVLAGMEPIQSFEDMAPQAQSIDAFYEDLIASELANHDWKFCTGDIELQRLADKPLYGFSAAYQFPSDPPVLHVKGIFLSDRPTRWRISQDKVYLDANETDHPVMTYQFRQITPLWPPYFILYIEARLASWISAAITRNAGIASMWTEVAESLLVKARSRDAMQQTVERLPIGRYTAARRGART